MAAGEALALRTAGAMEQAAQQSVVLTEPGVNRQTMRDRRAVDVAAAVVVRGLPLADLARWSSDAPQLLGLLQNFDFEQALPLVDRALRALQAAVPS